MDFHEHLRNLLDSDYKTGTNHIHEIYQQIIPEKGNYETREQELLTQYFMILLGYYTNKYKSAKLALKGGRSIQLLVDGMYNSEDMDIKIVKVSDSRTKQEVAKEVAETLVSGLPAEYGLSIQEPDPKRPLTEGIYKISMPGTIRRFKALVDVDYRELECQKLVDPDSIQCRLQKILSNTETISIPAKVSNKPITFHYNTYSIETQIAEKEELIKEYDELLRKGIIDALIGIDKVKDKSFIDALHHKLRSMKIETGYLGGVPANMITEMGEFFKNVQQEYKKYEAMVMAYISHTGVGEVFLLNKFERSLRQLKRGSRKARHLKYTLISKKHELKRKIKTLNRVKGMLINKVKSFRARKTANQLRRKEATKKIGKFMMNMRKRPKPYNSTGFYSATESNSESNNNDESNTFEDVIAGPVTQQELVNRLSRRHASSKHFVPATPEQFSDIEKRVSQFRTQSQQPQSQKKRRTKKKAKQSANQQNSSENEFLSRMSRTG